MTAWAAITAVAICLLVLPLARPLGDDDERRPRDDGR